jgi:hypothetical protein
MGDHVRAPRIHRAFARVERQIPSLLALFQFAGAQARRIVLFLTLDLPVERIPI